MEPGVGRASVIVVAFIARARFSSVLNVALATQLAQSFTRASPRSRRYRLTGSRLEGLESPSVIVRRLIFGDNGAFRNESAATYSTVRTSHPGTANSSSPELVVRQKYSGMVCPSTSAMAS